MLDILTALAPHAGRVVSAEFGLGSTVVFRSEDGGALTAVARWRHNAERWPEEQAAA